jgi:hypothetical protein
MSRAGGYDLQLSCERMDGDHAFGAMLPQQTARFEGEQHQSNRAIAEDGNLPVPRDRSVGLGTDSGNLGTEVNELHRRREPLLRMLA